MCALEAPQRETSCPERDGETSGEVGSRWMKKERKKEATQPVVTIIGSRLGVIKSFMYFMSNINMRTTSSAADVRRCSRVESA
jgi:hypothetical protein